MSAFKTNLLYFSKYKAQKRFKYQGQQENTAFWIELNFYLKLKWKKTKCIKYK